MGSGQCNQPLQGIDPCQQLKTMVFSMQWALEIKLVGAQCQMQAELSRGHGYVVSNGSFKDEASAALWIIEGLTSKTCLIGQWHTPGQSSDHSPFHSKLAGIVGVLYTLIFWPLDIVTPPSQPVCNGLLVVSWLLAAKLIEPMEPNANLLEAVRTLLHSCSYKVELAYVRGHQDNGDPMALT